MPHWAEQPTLTVNGTAVDTAPADGWWVVGRQWNDGDEVVLVLPLEPRFTVADPRLDAARGAVAVEYGPLVYCLEAVDNPGHRLDDLTVDTAVAPEVVPVDGPLEGVATIRTGGPRPASDRRLVVAVPSCGCASRRRARGVGPADRGALLHLGKPRARRDADLGAHRLDGMSLSRCRTGRHTSTSRGDRD